MGYIGNPPAERYTSIDKQTITGDGTVGPYTLTHSVGNAQEIEVFVNNVRQEPAVAYTVAADQLTMTGTVDAADDFYVVFQGKAKMTAIHPSTFDLTAANGTFTGDLTVDTSTLYVDSTNNQVGIGTTSPSDKLHVALPSGTNGDIVKLTRSGNAYNWHLGITSGSTFYISDNGGNTRLQVDTSGNVGIGVSSSVQSRLNTVGSSTSNFAASDAMYDKDHPGFIKIENQNDTTGVESGIVLRSKANGASVWSMYNKHSTTYLGDLRFRARTGGTASQDLVTFTYGGNVGIGTTSPTFTAGGGVHAKGSSGAFTSFRASVDSNTGVDFSADSSGNGYVFNRDNAALIVGTNNSEKVRITSGGNVGIGTSSPNYTLQVGDATADTRAVFNPNSAFAVGVSNGAGFAGWIGGSGVTDTMVFSSSGGAERMRITSAGDIAFGNTSANLVSNTSTQGGGGYVASDKHFEFATNSNRSAVEIGKNNANDGSLVTFRKQNTTVGSIGVDTTRPYFASTSMGVKVAGGSIHATNSSGASVDATHDLGQSNFRWKDLYLSGGVYLGGTGSANYLDDYEEGTFDVTMRRNGNAAGDYTRTCNYTKIGKTVILNFVNDGSVSPYYVPDPGAGGYAASQSVEIVSQLPFTPTQGNCGVRLAHTRTLANPSQLSIGARHSATDIYLGRAGNNNQYYPSNDAVTDSGQTNITIIGTLVYQTTN